MTDPKRPIAPERVFEALREVDVPNRHEGQPALALVIAQTIRRGPEAPRRKTALVAAVSLVAAFAIGIAGAWAWSNLGAKPAEPAPIANHRSAGPAKPHAAMLRNASGTVVAARDGKAFVVSSGEAYPLTEGSKVTTAVDSRAELELPSGVLVAVSQSTQLVVAAVGDLEINVSLAMGRVAFEVPKLIGGRKVSVETPDAKVVVRGTKFLVDVTPDQAAGGDTTITSVEVTRGSVGVLRAGSEVLLTAGESWSSAVIPEPIDLDLGAGRDADWSGPNAAQPRDRGTDIETLTTENQLFQEALDARNAGDRSKAVKLLAELLARFPKSPVAHEARVERFRTLEQSGDHAEAISEARRYLQAYPRGSVAKEARAIIEAERR